MKQIILILILVSGLWAHAAPTPTLIPFQGRLTDQAGNVYTSGQYTLIFNLYDLAVGGTVLWSETHQKVGVINGMVNVFLGSINPALATNDFSQVRYLGITIDPDNTSSTPDPEMVPRQMIIPAFWAKNSEKLVGYDWSAVFTNGNPATGTISGSRLTDNSVSPSKLQAGIAVPVGGVLMWWGTLASIPAGFEICDGGAATTPGASLQGLKPELRDRFVKGATSAAVDVQTTPITGGTHTLNLDHVHEMDHNHGSDGLYVPISGGPRNAIWFGEIGGGSGYARGTIGPGYGLVIGPTRGTSAEEQQNVKPGTAVFGLTGNASRSSTSLTTPNGAVLFPRVDNRPSFLEMFYIIRVK